MMDIWLCEYSPVQRAFHVDTLEKILAVNRSHGRMGEEVPGVIIEFPDSGVFLSSEEAHTFAEQWRLGHLES